MWNRVLVAITLLSAILIHISIAASQLLLGLGIVLCLIVKQKLAFPRIWVPLAAFSGWTLLADALSPDPWGGRAQIRKFFVYLLLPLIYTVLREHFRIVKVLLYGWIAAASASGLWSLFQFYSKWHSAKLSGESFYITYVGHRITGFESHWMTFGALQLSVFSLLLACILFARRELRLIAYASLPLFIVTILLGETRSVWLAAVVSTTYLLAVWRPKAVALVPVALVLLYLLSPPTTKERIQSIFAPHGETDSNRHRVVTFRTGVAMVRAHPIFGLGPEQIGRQFNAYVPADITRPLPVGYYGHLHNIYVQFAAERGLPALGFLLWMIGLAVFDFASALRRADTTAPMRAILHGAIAVIIGILVGGLFEHNLGDSEVLMMFVSVLGLGYAAVFNARVLQPAMAYPHVPEPFRSEEARPLGARLMS